MLTEPTIEKLYALRLGSMAAAFADQQKDAKVSSLSFDERFGMLVDAEPQASVNASPHVVSVRLRSAT